MSPNPCFSTEHSVFLAFNRVLPFIHREEEIVREIRLAKIDNPGKFIIVSVHWGEEYQLKLVIPAAIGSSNDCCGSGYRRGTSSPCGTGN